MIVSALVACGLNNEIGIDNLIPWHLPADLKYFKKQTTGHHIIMGRNTFESIGKPLPNRTNIVVTRDPYYLASGTVIAHSIEEALWIAKENNETEAFIIGGGQIYLQSVPYWDRIYLTRVHWEGKADAFFPKLDVSEWKCIVKEEHKADDNNKWDYDFLVFEK